MVKARIIAPALVLRLALVHGEAGGWSQAGSTGVASAQEVEEITCDFAGDGRNDLAVGVPGEDWGRSAVNIQYNKNGFLGTPAFLQGKAPDYEMPDGAHFGAALTCGDFDGNGVGDLAVGVPDTPWGAPSGCSGAAKS